MPHIAIGMLPANLGTMRGIDVFESDHQMYKFGSRISSNRTGQVLCMILCIIYLHTMAGVLGDNGPGVACQREIGELLDSTAG